MPGKEDLSPVAYAVGYGKPPSNGRFKPGHSGNPLGRPRKPIGARSTESLDDVYSAEGRRPLRIKEDNETRTLPAAQVAVRHQGMAAARGDAKAQRDFLAGVRISEREQRARNDKLVDAAIEYKALCETMQEDCIARNASPPRFEIDPDDLLVDVSARTVSLSMRSQRSNDRLTLLLSQTTQQVFDELYILQELIISDPDNSVIQRDIDFLETLRYVLGNRTHAASMLGISIRTLRNKLNEYASDGVAIPPPRNSTVAIPTDAD